ncbi:MAG: hypothetical protein C0502_06210 [Opitutus sp.]|nr:hypothetical protein [Opitutus sp.]
MNPKQTCRSLWAFAIALGFLAPAATIFSKEESAFVTRRGGLVQGTVSGSVSAVGPAPTLTIDAGAEVTGNVLVPGEHEGAELRIVGLPRRPAASPARTATVNLPSGDATFSSKLRAGESFELPALFVPAARGAAKTVTVGRRAAEPADFTGAGDIAVRDPAGTVAIPPGSYGALGVAQGTVVLGFLGATEPVFYEFQSLLVEAAGSIVAAGPVVVTVAEGATVRGPVGSADRPFWLDLRVARGDVLAAGRGSVQGVLTAPNGKVTIAAGAQIRGGVVSDRLEVLAGGHATAVAPDWSATSPAQARPIFPHRALRLQANLTELGAAFRHSFSPAVSYVRDVPFLMLAENRRPREHPRADEEEKRAFFSACCALFVDTGFERAGLMLVGYSPDPAVAPPAVRNLNFTRGQFETALGEIGRGADTAANIRAIVFDAGRLGQFYSQMTAGSAGSR